MTGPPGVDGGTGHVPGGRVDPPGGLGGVKATRVVSDAAGSSRPLKAVEVGQVGSFRRVCRLRTGLPATEDEEKAASERR